MPNLGGLISACLGPQDSIAVALPNHNGCVVDKLGALTIVVKGAILMLRSWRLE